jgi:hypothetical protein
VANRAHMHNRPFRSFVTVAGESSSPAKEKNYKICLVLAPANGRSSLDDTQEIDILRNSRRNNIGEMVLLSGLSWSMVSVNSAASVKDSHDPQ